MSEIGSFGSYEILGKIETGGFSEIFKVRKGGQVFALKKLRPHLQFDSEYRFMIQTEARLLTEMNDPEHFPILYESGNLNDEEFLILELIEGLDLRKAIAKGFDRQRPPGVLVSAEIASHIASGLENLHAQSFTEGRPTVHGDLRPSNVMLGLKGGVKMIDLGLKGGTFDYMPLERLHDHVISPYSDIFGLGHILYELLHGRLLFQGKTKLEAYFEMREREIREELFDPEIPDAILKILIRCLNQDPSLRYSQAGEVNEDLRRYLSQQPEKARAGSIERWFKAGR